MVSHVTTCAHSSQVPCTLTTATYSHPNKRARHCALLSSSQVPCTLTAAACSHPSKRAFAHSRACICAIPTIAPMLRPAMPCHAQSSAHAALAASTLTAISIQTSSEPPLLACRACTCQGEAGCAAVSHGQWYRTVSQMPKPPSPKPPKANPCP